MPLITSLTAYWKLDEASGNALDAHGTSTLTDNNGIGTAAGKINTARDFDASLHQYFSHTDSADLSTGDIDFTFAAWVKADSVSSFPVVATKGWSGNATVGGEWIAYVSSGANLLTFEVNSGGVGGVVQATNFGAMPTGVWCYVVVWHDSVNNQIGISVNAGTANTASHSAGVQDGTNDFRIGSSPLQSIYWDGLIDEAGFWKRVLTAQDRTDLYNAGAGLAYPFTTTSGALLLRRRRRLLAGAA